MHPNNGPDQKLIDQFVGAAHGDLEKVRHMVDERPDLVFKVSSQNETALQAAAHLGQRKIAEYLLAQGAPLDICTAAMLGKADDVSRMLSADPGLAQSSGAHGIPILFYPSLGGQIKIAEELLARGADINAGKGMNTSLHAAALTDRAEMAEWLLAHGARTDIVDYAGKTPLEVATEHKRYRVEAVLRSSVAGPDATPDNS